MSGYEGDLSVEQQRALREVCKKHAGYNNYERAYKTNALMINVGNDAYFTYSVSCSDEQLSRPAQ